MARQLKCEVLARLGAASCGGAREVLGVEGEAAEGAKVGDDQPWPADVGGVVPAVVGNR